MFLGTNMFKARLAIILAGAGIKLYWIFGFDWLLISYDRLILISHF